MYYFRPVALLWVGMPQQTMVFPIAQMYPKKLWNECSYSLPGKPSVMYNCTCIVMQTSHCCDLTGVELFIFQKFNNFAKKWAKSVCKKTFLFVGHGCGLALSEKVSGRHSHLQLSITECSLVYKWNHSTSKSFFLQLNLFKVKLLRKEIPRQMFR